MTRLRFAGMLLAVAAVAACEGERPHAFQQAVERHREQASAPVRQSEVRGAAAARGARLIRQYGCGSCHTIPGIPGAHGRVGPPLTFWAERVYIAGQLSNRPDNLVRWLMNPPAVEPGTAMPNLGLSEVEASAIGAYLYTLH